MKTLMQIMTAEPFIIFIHKYHYCRNIKPLKLLLSYTKLPAISSKALQKGKKKIVKISFKYCILVLQPSNLIFSGCLKSVQCKQRQE